MFVHANGSALFQRHPANLLDGLILCRSFPTESKTTEQNARSFTCARFFYILLKLCGNREVLGGSLFSHLRKIGTVIFSNDIKENQILLAKVG